MTTEETPMSEHLEREIGEIKATVLHIKEGMDDFKKDHREMRKRVSKLENGFTRITTIMSFVSAGVGGSVAWVTSHITSLFHH